MSDTAPTFPETSYRDWLELVQEDLGVDATERLRSVTLDGVEVEALYTGETSPAPLPRPIASAAGWETWASLAVESESYVQEGIENRRRLGATGLWLEIGDEAKAKDVGAAVARAAEREMAVGVEGLADGALLAAAIGEDGKKASVCLGLDPVTLSARPEMLEEVASWACDRAPEVRPFLLSAEAPDWVGAGAVFELAWLVSGLASLLETADDAGIPPERIADRVTLLLPVGRDVHLQIAKVRAARVLWSMVLGAWDVAASGHPARILARTSWRTKSRWDAKTNLLRETVESFAAVVGGCDGLLTRSFDGDGTDLGRRLQLTLPLVLRDESGLDRVEDPAGGSWAVETLTRRLAEDAWAESRRIEEEGGIVASLEGGGLRDRTREAARERRNRLRRREEPVTGISIHPRPERAPAAETRSGPRPGLLPRGLSWAELLGAAREGRSRGELRSRTEGASLLGDDLPRWTDASSFEAFRDRAAARDAPPRALVVGIGSLRELSGSLGFARRLLVAGGFEVDEPPPFETPDEARDASRESLADLVVLVLPRDAGEARRAEAALAIGSVAPGILAMAGEIRTEGIAHYLHEGCDAASVLEALLEEVDG